jgi:hypothetical protein
MLTDFSIFSSSLRILELSFNKLHGEIPTTIRSFAELSVLMLSDNYFEGIICESHFTNLSKLEWLYICLTTRCWLWRLVMTGFLLFNYNI